MVPTIFAYSVWLHEERIKQINDIDLLVKTEKKTSPWFPGGLIADLESILGRKVDIVTERELNRFIRDRVLEDAVSL